MKKVTPGLGGDANVKALGRETGGDIGVIWPGLAEPDPRCSGVFFIILGVCTTKQVVSGSRLRRLAQIMFAGTPIRVKTNWLGTYQLVLADIFTATTNFTSSAMAVLDLKKAKNLILRSVV